jgi:hemoglobin
MRKLSRWSTPLLAAGVLAVAATASRAADEPPNTAPLDRKTLDDITYRTLRDVINHGAHLYNDNGDASGCYRLYEGALMTVRPLLDHRPKLQEAITDGIAAAQRNPSLERRAFVLREVLDKIREDVHPPMAKKPGEPLPAPGKNTLWDRLGGEKGVTKVVNDFVAKAAADPKVNFDRNGKYKLDEEAVAKLKKRLVEQISEATGGPLKYEGRDMKTVHKGMGITNDEFDALAKDLRTVLMDNGVKPDDVGAVLDAVLATRKDIVESKEGAAPPDKKTLWARLGGEDGVAKVVDECVNAAAKDPKVKFLNDPATRLKRDELDDFKKKTIDYLSSISEGPRKYSGKNLKGTLPAEIRVTGDEFDALLGHLKTALEKNGVKSEDVKALTGEVERTRKDVIESKVKPDGKEAGGKGTVKGTVTLDGKPLTGAAITFFAADGSVRTGLLDDEGKFQLGRLAPGRYKVVIETVLPGGAPAKERLPAKYSDPEKSALQFEVTGQEQAADFDLKSK